MTYIDHSCSRLRLLLVRLLRYEFTTNPPPESPRETFRRRFPRNHDDRYQPMDRMPIPSHEIACRRGHGVNPSKRSVDVRSMPAYARIAVTRSWQYRRLMPCR